MGIRSPNEISGVGLPRSSQAAPEALEDAPLLESQNPSMIGLLETAKRAAAADTTILLTGESGTGKDVLAHQIHRWSPRRDGPFVVLNCTALTEVLLENELFHHVRGGFTDVVNDDPGRHGAGRGGTVLFDEIADLTPALQAKLLRFVQEQRLEQISSDRTINVRMIAASNHNLEAEVAAGRFREDLYYRLNVISFTLPPLSERTQDILPFAQWALKRMSIATARSALSLSREAAEALVNYGWPGNLRELHNALSRAAAFTRAETITFDDLPDSIRHATSGMFIPIPHGTRLKDLEREHILRVLATSSTLEQAAATLGIHVTTLWRKRRYHRIG
jgi:two-component system, NtrC family, response regulator AlgB